MLGLKIFFRRLFKSKTPIFTFTSPGINEEGHVQLEMEWNDAFIQHVRSHGFIGHNEEECAQMFLMSFTRQPEQEANQPSNPASHPYLNESTGNMVKR